ncbi:hypothetical protein QBC44DRAFT_375565 [Cladorrhinum sp. PSN332]|nr:hypothetical protein QBC44DRAFT_375565 [Cladorrhinum sp. PSN332]
MSKGIYGPPNSTSQTFAKIDRHCHIPQVCQSSDLPEVYDRHDFPEVQGFTDFPEVGCPTPPKWADHRPETVWSPSASTVQTSATSATPPESVKQGDTGLDNTTPRQHSDRWWRRHRILLLALAILLGAGAIATGVAGGLVASSRRENPQNNVAGDANASSTSSSYTATLSSTLQQQPPSTTPTSSSATASSTSTVSPSSEILIGRATQGTQSLEIAFLPSQPCQYEVMGNTQTTIPCGVPVTLPDGITYTWNGCGQDTWVTWIAQPAQGQQEKEKVLGACKSNDGSVGEWCGGWKVQGNWVCG